MNLTAKIFKGMNTPDGRPSAETLERWKELTDGLVESMTVQEENDMLKAKNKHLCEQVDLAKKLEVENEELRANLREALRQNEIMQSKLDMVHLIFGRNR